MNFGSGGTWPVLGSVPPTLPPSQPHPPTFPTPPPFTPRHPPSHLATPLNTSPQHPTMQQHPTPHLPLSRRRCGCGGSGRRRPPSTLGGGAWGGLDHRQPRPTATTDRQQRHEARRHHQCRRRHRPSRRSRVPANPPPRHHHLRYQQCAEGPFDPDAAILTETVAASDRDEPVLDEFLAKARNATRPSLPEAENHGASRRASISSLQAPVLQHTSESGGEDKGGITGKPGGLFLAELAAKRGAGEAPPANPPAPAGLLAAIAAKKQQRGVEGGGGGGGAPGGLLAAIQARKAKA